MGHGEDLYREKECAPSFEFGERATREGLVDSLLMRAGEVAAVLSLGRSKVYELMASGALPTVRIGRAVRVPRAALEEWVASQIRHGEEET